MMHIEEQRENERKQAEIIGNAIREYNYREALEILKEGGSMGTHVPGAYGNGHRLTVAEVLNRHRDENASTR